MKILVDTNIVLDFLLQREPFFENAERLFQSVAKDEVVGYVTATTLTDIFYIARRHTQSLDKAKQAVKETLTAMAVCPVDRGILESALNFDCNDFEDAVQICSAMAQGLDAIVTRNAKDFSGSTLPIYAPADFLNQLASSDL